LFAKTGGLTHLLILINTPKELGVIKGITIKGQRIVAKGVT